MNDAQERNSTRRHKKEYRHSIRKSTDTESETNMENGTYRDFNSVSINSHVNLQKDHELDSVTDFNVVGEQIETNYSDYQEINKSIFDALADINNNLQCKKNVITTPLYKTMQKPKN